MIKVKNQIIKIINYIKYYFYFISFEKIKYQINGCKFILNPNYEIDKQILLDKFEKKLTLIVKKLIKKNFVCFDLGANFGYYSVLISKLMNNTGKVYAFEPADYQSERLRRNLDTNNCKNTEIIKKAVGEKSGLLDFYEFSAGSSLEGHSTCEEKAIIHLNNKNKNTFKKKKVEQIKIDEFVKNRKLKRVDFIKIDVEGYEVKCLRGARNTINKFKPTVIFELGYERNKIINYTLRDFFSNLKNYNFFAITNGPLEKKIYKINKKNLKNVTDILAIHTRKNKNKFFFYK